MADVRLPNAGAAEGGAIHRFLREGRTLRTPQYKPRISSTGCRKAARLDLFDLFQCRAAHLRHQESANAARSRLVHPADTGKAPRPAALRSAREPNRGRTGRYARQHLHYRQKLGNLYSALHRSRPAEADGKVKESA